MRYFAKLNPDNIVEQIVVAENLETLKATTTGTWIETFTGNIHDKKVSNIGYKYYEEYNFFAQPQPYPSWSLNYSSGNWDSPIPKPNDGYLYEWNETNKEWDNLGNACPYPSWKWDEEKQMFKPPIPNPIGCGNPGYKWHEDLQSWQIENLT